MLGGCGGVLFDEGPDCVSGERCSGSGREQRVIEGTLAFFHPGAQHGHHVGPQRGSPGFSSLAAAAKVGAAAQLDVTVAQAGEL